MAKITANNIQAGSITLTTLATSVSNSITSASVTSQAAFDKANTAVSTVGGNTSVTGNILPSSTLTYDLGSDALRWRDLYLSGNTLNLGTASITTDANTGAIAFVPAVTASNPNPVGLIITANGVLTTIQTNGGVVYASNIETIVANTGTIVFDSDLMYYAANTANLAMAVNATQNTNITNADAKAQAAFNAANTVSPLDSYARQTANAAFDKANTAITTSGGSIIGSLNVSQNLTVTGNLSVLGTTTSINTEQYEIVDPMIKLGIGNYVTDQIDIGFAGHYNDGANAHTGLFRDFATKDYYLFQGYTPELTGNNNIDISHASFSTANLVASLKGNVIATTVTIGGRNQASVDSTQNTNITHADNKAQAAFSSANTNATNLTNFIELFSGVEVTQNNRIAVVETYVQAAFDKANTGGGAGSDQYARDTANTASSNTIIIQGVDTAQNTRMSIIEGVDTAQNTRMSIIEGVDTTQNTDITNADAKAQAAFDVANTSITTSGGTITGSLTVNGNLTVSGITQNTLEVANGIINLAVGNVVGDNVSIGILAHYNNGDPYESGPEYANVFTGLLRPGFTENYWDPSFHLVKDLDPSWSACNSYGFAHSDLVVGKLTADGNITSTFSYGGSVIEGFTVRADQIFYGASYGVEGTNLQTAIGNIQNDYYYLQGAYNQANTTADLVRSDSLFNESTVTLGSYVGTGQPVKQIWFTGPVTGNVRVANNSSQANSIGYLGVPQSNLNPMSASYTLTISDSGEHLYMVPSSSALTVNIPPNSSVPFPIGTAIVTVLDAAFKSNVVPQTGVTLRLAGNTAGSNVSRTLSEYSMASLIKVGTDVWYISGAGVT